MAEEVDREKKLRNNITIRNSVFYVERKYITLLLSTFISTIIAYNDINIIFVVFIVWFVAYPRLLLETLRITHIFCLHPHKSGGEI